MRGLTLTVLAGCAPFAANDASTADDASTSDEPTAADTAPAETDPPDCTTQPLTFEVGVGETAFASHTAGAPLRLVTAGQATGGRHVAVAVRAAGVRQSVVVGLTLHDVESEQDVTLDRQRYPVFLVPTEGPGTPWACEGTIFGLPARLDHTVLGEGLGDWPAHCGRTTRVTATLELVDPVTGADTVIATDTIQGIAWPPDDERAACGSDPGGG